MSLSILVLLLPPNKHAFTAKAVWADLPDVGHLRAAYSSMLLDLLSPLESVENNFEIKVQFEGSTPYY